MTEIVAVLRNTISTFMATIKKVYRAHNIVKLFSIFKLTSVHLNPLTFA